MPLRRIALIAALCGAAVGLRQVAPRRSPAPFPVPSLQRAVGDDLLAADTQYRFALFVQQCAGELGVPGVASPSAWEEQAVAQYERLALRAQPLPAACHRLGIIYGRRGYLAQARDVLGRGAALDPAACEVCLALALVYSEQPVPRPEAVKVTRLLQRQPRWWSLLTLEDLARRLQQPQEANAFGAAARHELWRFGTALAVLLAVGGLLILGALTTSAVLVLRALFTRDRPTRFWYTPLHALSGLDLLDVAALMAFGNALGEAARRSLPSALPEGSPVALAAQVAHYLLVAAPALALVVRRVRRLEPKWPRALGLASEGLLRHALQGLLGLGLTLAAVSLMWDRVVLLWRALLPGVGAIDVGGSVPGPVAAADVLIAVVLAPLAEELIFRGFVFRALLERGRPLLAALMSAGLFAAVHLVWEPRAFFNWLVLGLVSACTYRATRSLVPSLLLHAGYNAYVVATLFVLRM